MGAQLNWNKGREDKTDFPIIPSDIPFEEVLFHSSGNYCVCFADIVDSTTTISNIKDGKDRAKYYSIFLNYISTIARHFDGKIIKNAGDGLLWYFPETQDYANFQAFEKVVDCCMTLTEAHTIINNFMLRERLPCIDYRISADYGRLEIALTKTSVCDDFFGPTMNMCAKINSKAPLNSLVIGSDLYEIIRHFPIHSAYHFNEVKKRDQNTFGISKTYPVFSVTRKIKDTIEYYRNHQFSNSLEKVSSLSSIAKTELYNNSRSFSYEFTGKSEEHRKQEDDNRALKSNSNKQSANVMIIDDEPDALLSLKTFLEDKPYNIEVFSSAREALQKFAILGPLYYDLVISDIRMPDMNGLQLYNSLRAINRNVKIIFVTALDAVQELASILPGLKEKDIMRKPISRNEFLEIVRQSTAE